MITIVTISIVMSSSINMIIMIAVFASSWGLQSPATLAASAEIASKSGPSPDRSVANDHAVCERCSCQNVVFVVVFLRTAFFCFLRMNPREPAATACRPRRIKASAKRAAEQLLTAGGPA